MTEQKLARLLLDAVWEENISVAKKTLLNGANPNWNFNGHPILMHAVYTRNVDMVMLLINHGAEQTSEALGFALENGIGELVLPLALQGVVPKVYKNKQENAEFGPYPARYAPLYYQS